jgi:hypothetical protein
MQVIKLKKKQKVIYTTIQEKIVNEYLPSEARFPRYWLQKIEENAQSCTFEQWLPG